MKVPPLTVVVACPRCGVPIGFTVEVAPKAVPIRVEAYQDRPERAYLMLSLKAEQVEHYCPDGQVGADIVGDTGQTG